MNPRGLPHAGATDLLRVVTAGSVDDGKSTLIGRLLHDAKGIFEDQLAAVASASRRRGRGELDLSLLTDGLQAEREQGITIDVAYRYFSTLRRKFIIADAPGHEQYTRNMVTGASTADLAIILCDARNGVVTQTRRHTYLATLLGVRHLVFAVNKMDLVDYSRERFDAIAADIDALGARLGAHDARVIPISALDGDNVVESSSHMRWYDGPPLLEILEHISVVNDRRDRPFRFPIQGVVRPSGDAAGREWHDFRALSGRIESGQVAVDDDVMVLPSGARSRVAGIRTYDGSRDSAQAGESVLISLANDLDVARGDLLAGADGNPRVTCDFEALLCWFSDRPLDPARRLLLKSGTRTVKAKVPTLHYAVDVNTLDHHPRPHSLVANDIARATVRLQQSLPVDSYLTNRVTGSFILIDEIANDTVAVGMVQ